MSSREYGLASVEFAIIGAVFFVVLLGIIEFGRLLYAWGVLTEGTRRGVRVAVVCPVNHSAIPAVTIFAGPRDSSSNPILPDLSTDNVVVEYLNQHGIPLADPIASFRQIRYVRVKLQNYTHQLFIPFVNITLNSPAFESTLPRESLGVPRVGAGPECFGTSA